MKKQNEISRRNKLTAAEHERIERILNAKTFTEQVKHLNPCCRQPAMWAYCVNS